MKTTKAQLQADLAATSKNELLACIALNEMVRGNVQWFKLGKVKVGVCQPACAHGGVIIQTDCSGSSPSSVAEYFEDWFKRLADYGHSAIPEINQLRELSYLAQEYIRTAQAAA